MNINSTQYLKKINSPDDLKRLSVDELPLYCDELREFIISEVSVNPGHLGSSLGALELTVALHYVYDTPHDKLVWDVGHQAYAHKIITGRRDQFSTNRKMGGISGFPKICESEYDAFGVGHASTSISAALGMAVASRLSGKKRKVVAIIGDGSMGGGLAFEGLNNAGSMQEDLLVILNDNKISIDPNVGALKEYLLNMSTSPRYNNLKAMIWSSLSVTPRFRRMLQKLGDGAKSFFLHQSNLFESLRFRYFGPVDGNDVKALVRALQDLKNIEGAKLLHTLTVKGKGYKPAEDNQTEWHAPGIFDHLTGEKAPSDGSMRYQNVFGETLLELARENDRIVGITPAMPTGSSLNVLMEAMPERAFDVGIAEGHAVTFAAGLAAGGKLPFCSIYSSFMQRAVDNIIHDIAIQNLEVVLPLDRAGIVGEDGATHHGVFDIALLRSIPNIIIAAPSDASELRSMMYTASLGGYRAAFVIRYPRGGCIARETWRTPMERFEIGRGRMVNDGKDLAIISVGTMIVEAAEAVKQLYRDHGISAAHYDLRFVKPLDEQMLREIASRFDRIITVEDGSVAGGAGSAVVEFYAANGIDIRIINLGLDDRFVEHGTVAQLKQLCGIDTKGIIAAATTKNLTL